MDVLKCVENVLHDFCEEQQNDGTSRVMQLYQWLQLLPGQHFKNKLDFVQRESQQL